MGYWGWRSNLDTFLSLKFLDTDINTEYRSSGIFSSNVYLQFCGFDIFRSSFNCITVRCCKLCDDL